jgi:hypothetical protein
MRYKIVKLLIRQSTFGYGYLSIVLMPLRLFFIPISCYKYNPFRHRCFTNRWWYAIFVSNYCMILYLTLSILFLLLICVTACVVCLFMLSSAFIMSLLTRALVFIIVLSVLPLLFYIAVLLDIVIQQMI